MEKRRISLICCIIWAWHIRIATISLKPVRGKTRILGRYATISLKPVRGKTRITWESVFADKDSTNTKNVASEDAKTSTIDSGLAKSLTMYRKLIESGGTLTDEQQAELEKKIKVIQERDVVEADTPHDPLEIEFEKNISIGPPTLTRFEKARILGARALQLSLGAPTFIPIPEYANISLDIAMEELKQRVMPIVIKRTLPNGDYQNIGIEAFQ